MPAKAHRVPKEQPQPLQTAAGVRGRLEEFQPVQSAALRVAIRVVPWLLLVHSLFALRIDPMFATGEWTAAAALFLFGFLMNVIPEAFRTLWDRNMIACRPTHADGQAESPVDAASPDQGAASLEFARFISEFSRLLNGRGQMVSGLVLGLLGGGWVPFGVAIEDLSRGTNLAMALADMRQYLAKGMVGYLLSTRFLLYFIVAFLLGLLVWRMLATSYKIWQLGNRFDLIPQLGHPDRCGGFAPLGYLCLWNALISSVAAIYMGAWIILLGSTLGSAGSSLGQRYSAAFYVPFYSTYLSVPIVYAIFSFFVPVWNIHEIMMAKRELVLQKLDQLSNSINRLSREMLEQAEARSPAQNEDTAKRLELMRQTYENNKKIPVWPFNTDIMTRFASSLAVPLLGLTHLGQPVVNIISEFIKFLNR